MKQDLLEDARKVFQGTGVQLQVKGAKYLGSAIGEPMFVKSYFERKAGEWTKELKQLALYARTEPHAAIAAFTHGLRGRYLFLLQNPDAPEETLETLQVGRSFLSMSWRY